MVAVGGNKHSDCAQKQCIPTFTIANNNKRNQCQLGM